VEPAAIMNFKVNVVPQVFAHARLPEEAAALYSFEWPFLTAL